MSQTMTKIDSKKMYSLTEIAEMQMIPGVRTYGVVYNLVSRVKEDTDGKERLLNEETTKTCIKAEDTGKPWNKISGKIMVSGSELIKFLKLNNLYK